MLKENFGVDREKIQITLQRNRKKETFLGTIVKSKYCNEIELR